MHENALQQHRMANRTSRAREPGGPWEFPGTPALVRAWSRSAHDEAFGVLDGFDGLRGFRLQGLEQGGQEPEGSDAMPA